MVIYCIWPDKPQNSVDPDQLTSSEASWSWATLLFYPHVEYIIIPVIFEKNV